MGGVTSWKGQLGLARVGVDTGGGLECQPGRVGFHRAPSEWGQAGQDEVTVEDTPQRVGLWSLCSPEHTVMQICQFEALGLLIGMKKPGLGQQRSWGAQRGRAQVFPRPDLSCYEAIPPSGPGTKQLWKAISALASGTLHQKSLCSNPDCMTFAQGSPPQAFTVL